MATIKAYTDLGQSRKLAEILPIESADMCYPIPCKDEDKPLLEQGGFGTTPCWSLAALLEIIPYRLNDGSDFTIEKWEEGYLATYGASCHKYGNELIDACYEMIIKLYERKIL